MLKKKDIGIIEEFLLKFYKINIFDEEKISKILGIDLFLINNSIANLFFQNLIKMNQDNRISLTKKGEEALKEAKTIQPEQVTVNFLMNGLTGELTHSTRKLFTGNEVRKKNLCAIKPLLNKPTLEEFEFNKINKVLKEKQKEFPDDSLAGDLITINELEKCYLSYRKRSMLIFMHENDAEADLEIKIFDGMDRENELENIILRMEKDGIKQIPFDRKDTLDVINNEEVSITTINPSLMEEALFNTKKLTLNKQLSEQLTQQLHKKEIQLNENDLDSESKITDTQVIRGLNEKIALLEAEKDNINRYIETYEHRKILEDSFEKAEKLVLIISPWIRFGAFDYIIQNKIRKALKRKIKVIIGYGISPDDVGHTGAVNILEKMRKEPNGENLILIKLANTHEKVLLVDTKYVVITSFNWLSFKGDPKLGFRQETGLYTIDSKTIQANINSLEKRMNIDIQQYLK